jgi:hypothetical protein
MKKIKLFLVFLAVLLAAGCAEGPLEPDADADIEVGLTALTLSANELATIMGNELELTLTKNPAFANINEVRWESSDPKVANVVATADGLKGRITTAASLSEPQTAEIKVSAVADPSIYVVCPVSVYPDYTSTRSWNFNTASDTSDMVGDIDNGLGMTILTTTGGLSEYIEPLAKGLWPIVPQDPYRYGAVPSGGTRSGVRLYTGGNGSSGFSSCYLRTNGNSRMLKIAAIQGPFTVTVNYASNGTAGVHADIRFGDTEGFLYVGDGSASNGDYRTVSWPYDKDDIIPFVYIETQGSVRIFDVIIEEGARYPYTPVPDNFDITGANSFIKGQTETYTTDISQTLTNPEYVWKIIEGEENAEIVRRVDGGKSIELKALDPGEVTLQLDIITSNPYDSTVIPKTITKTKTVVIEGYTPIESVSIDSTATVAEGGIVQLTATINPGDATSPAYEWIITNGTNYGAISANGDAQTATFNGTAQGVFAVKVKVTTRDPANPSDINTMESNECTVTVTAPLQEVIWLFNETTATNAGLTKGTDGYYNISSETEWGNGLTLLLRGANANVIRPSQKSSDGDITGCIQVGGSGDIAKITGVTAGSTVTLELKYSGTGGGQTGRYPTVTIGNSTTNAQDINGTTLIAWTQNFTVEDGEDIILKAFNAIRIYSIKIAK